MWYLSDLRIAEGEETQSLVDKVNDLGEPLNKRIVILHSLRDRVSDCEYSDLEDKIENEKANRGA